MAAVKALQQWCKIQCEGYKDVAITNMTTSFRDGLAFCALIHKHRPDLIDFDSLRKENVYDNNHLAFGVAEKELGIPALLDAEDMVALRVPDRLSILTYVSQYYNYFHGRSPIGGLAGVKRPAEEVREEVPGKRNQPVTAKVFSSPKVDTENKREILVERSNKPGTLSSSCNVCNKHVHLVQRHLVDGKLYHRSCFKCSECSNILLSGTYKPGKEPNTFTCRTHQSTQKLPTPQARQVPQPPRDSQPTPVAKATPSTPAVRSTSPSPAGLGTAPPTSTPSPHWLAGKSGSPSTPTPAPRSKPVLARSAPPSAVKSPSDRSVPAEPPKPPSNVVLRNHEARQRFFEASSIPGCTGPVTRSTRAAGANEKAGQPLVIAPAVGRTNENVGLPVVIAPAKGRTKENMGLPVVTAPAKGRTNENVGLPVVTAPAKGRTNENTALPAVTAPAKAPPLVTVTAASGGPGKGRVLLRVGDWPHDKENEKEEAKCVISKMVTEEIRKSSSPSRTPAGMRTAPASSNTSPGDTGSKGPSGRVQLKPLHKDSGESPAPASTKTPSWVTAKEKDSSKTTSSLPPVNKEADTAPADWRSMLKPVAKDSKPGTPKDSTLASIPNKKPEKKPETTTQPSSGKFQASGPALATTSPGLTNNAQPSSALPSKVTNGTAQCGKAKDSRSGTNAALSNSSSSGTSIQKLAKLKPDYIPKDKILRELQEIEKSLDELEKQGVELEKQLRRYEEEGKGDVLMNDLMVDWFNLIRNKQVYMRRESELVYIGRTQDLEEEQPTVEAELRKLLEKPEHLKTFRDRTREEELMAKLVEIVNDRNAIVDGLDEDRLREEEEDEQLNKMMQDLDMRKEQKKKSPMSKLFGWRRREALEN